MLRRPPSAFSYRSVVQSPLPLPEIGNAFNEVDRQTKARTVSKRFIPARRLCMLLLIGGIIAAILASVAGIVLATTLPQSKSTTSITTFTTISTLINSTTTSFTSITSTTSSTSTASTSGTTSSTSTTSTKSTTSSTSTTSTTSTTSSTTTSEITSTTTTTSTTTSETTSTTSTTSTTTDTTTTTTTTTTETTTRCSSRGHGNLGLLSGYASSSWTSYSYTYTATKSEHILIFGFKAAINRTWLIDDISVVDNALPSNQLLNNPSFEDSNTSISNWVQWCTSHCHYGTSGKLISGTDCYLGVGNCFSDSCLGPDIDFLGQYFPTTPGSTYTISFQILLTGTDGYYYTTFYADLL
ncbi:unnamed protein product [Rotaria sordida]|uniref:Uncharacterized protein n=1 Tax=Rotaria sordida TaxID=392033 RepID=A0A818RRP5_9BILA|nr:unnamed protein product [Rotaria sordida]CAF3654838.1 unnamed protein product [Rotaria sordida]